jgi:hypothetical protein
VVGENGTIRHFDGSVWSSPSTGLDDDFAGVCGFDDGEAVAVGSAGSVIDYRHAQWQVRLAGSPRRLRAAAYDIIVGEAPSGGVAIVGVDTWSFPGALNGVTAFDPSNAYAVGDAGAIHHFDGTQWTVEASGTGEDLNGVTGLNNRFGDPMRMYAVGDAGTVRVWKGGPWEPAALPAEAMTMDLVDVWAAAIDDVFAVASNSSSVLRYDDPYETGPWTVEATPAAGFLLTIGGWRADTYAVSSLGEVLHHDGSQWHQIDAIPGGINDIRVVGEAAFYAVGDGGALRYYEHGEWAAFVPEYAGDFLGVWARSGWSTVAVGTNGAVWVHRTN